MLARGVVTLLSSFSVLQTRQRLFLPGLFVLVIFLYTVHPLSDSDQLYHLKVGQVIWETKSVPKHDIFTYTAPGVRWVTHEWLAELMFYGVYRIAGFWGVIGLVSAAAAGTMWLLFIIAVHRGADRDIGALLLFLFAYLTFDWWLARPQVFAYFSFALLLYFLEEYRWKQRRGYLYAAIVTQWFWANVNASFILGLIVFGVYWFISILHQRWPKAIVEGNASVPSPRLLGLSLIVAAAIALVNPNGYTIFLYSYYVQPAVKALNILEWRPIQTYLGDPHIKVLLSEMAIGDLFIVFWFGLRKESRDLFFLAIATGVSVMPFLSLRHYAFWPLAVMAPVLVGVSVALQRFRSQVGHQRLYAVLVGLGVLFALLGFYNLPRAPLQQTPLPIFGADFVERIGLKGPRFNLYDEGGYLIWQSWPRERVFIDGRSEIHAGKPLEEFFDILHNAPDWDALVNDKYQINYFFLAYHSEALSHSILPLVGKLLSEHWTLVYWDDATLVYVRNTPQNADIIRQYGLYYVSPFRDPSTVTPDEIPVVKQNLLKALSAAPYSRELRAYAANFAVNEKN